MNRCYVTNTHFQTLYTSTYAAKCTLRLCICVSLLSSHINRHLAFTFASQFGAGVEELLVYVVSWVGIGVALVCLATCLITLCCQGAPWHTDHSTIHCNLWANLLITELIFLIGANKTKFTVSTLMSDRSACVDIYYFCVVFCLFYTHIFRFSVPSLLACCTFRCFLCFAGCVWRQWSCTFCRERCLKDVTQGGSIFTSVDTLCLGWWWLYLQPLTSEDMARKQRKLDALSALLYLTSSINVKSLLFSLGVCVYS